MWAMPPLALLCFALAYQNCGRFYTPNDVVFLSSAAGEPGNGTIDKTCLKNPGYDACVIYKNPVAQKKSPMTTEINASSIMSLQHYGVKITGLKPGEGLKSDFVSVTGGDGVLVDPAAGLKFSAVDDPSAFNQVMTYYWLNRMGEYIGARTGDYPAAGRSLQVIVDDTITGWSPKTSTIHIGQSEDRNLAWSAEVAVHLMGVANLYYASNGATAKLNAKTHADCGLKGLGCCAAPIGCARAISSGVGDYFVAMMFPQNPTVGEALSNSSDGLVTCDLSRNIPDAKSRMPVDVFKACIPNLVPGEAATMGTIYASIWWEVRKAAMKENPDDARAIDTIFMYHLGLLTGDDIFKSGIEKAKAVDDQLYSGRYSPLFDAELEARGL